MKIKLSRKSARNLANIIEKMADLDFVDCADVSDTLFSPDSDKVPTYNVKIVAEPSKGEENGWRGTPGELRIEISEIEDRE